MTSSPQATPVPNSPGQPVGGEPAGIIDQTQRKVGEVVDKAQQTAGQVTGQAKQQATSQLESQKDRAVDTLVTIAQALRQTGQRLHQQDQGAVGGYVDKAAERVEGLTNHLRTRDVPELLGDTEDLARRRPGMFLAAALGLGFAGARFLMSSGQRGAQRRRALYGTARTGGAYSGPTGYGSSDRASSSGQIPPTRDPAHRPPGPIGAAQPEPVNRATGTSAGRGGSAGDSGFSATGPSRRTEAEQA